MATEESSEEELIQLTLSSTEVGRFMHSRECIGRAIGPLPLSAATCLRPLTRTLLCLFSVGSLIRAFGHPDHMWSLLALTGLYDSTPSITDPLPHLSSLTIQRDRSVGQKLPLCPQLSYREGAGGIQA